MYAEIPRIRRLRHSRKSVVFSALLASTAFFLGFSFFGTGELLLVAPVAAAVVAGVFAYRYRTVAARLPQPHGRGLTEVIGTDKVRAQGVAILVLGIATLFVPFIALFFLPAVSVVAFILGLMGGLATSEVVYFVWVSRFEKRTSSRVISVTEYREEDGRQELVRSLQLEEEPN